MSSAGGGRIDKFIRLQYYYANEEILRFRYINRVTLCPINAVQLECFSSRFVARDHLAEDMSSALQSV